MISDWGQMGTSWRLWHSPDCKRRLLKMVESQMWCPKGCMTNLFQEEVLMQGPLLPPKVRNLIYKFVILYMILCLKGRRVFCDHSFGFQRRVLYHNFVRISLLVPVTDKLIQLLAEKLKFRELFKYYAEKQNAIPFFLVKLVLEKQLLQKGWQFALLRQMLLLFYWYVFQ